MSVLLFEFTLESLITIQSLFLIEREQSTRLPLEKLNKCQLQGHLFNIYSTDHLESS